MSAEYCEVCEEADAVETVTITSGATVRVCEECAVAGAEDGACIRGDEIPCPRCGKPVDVDARGMRWSACGEPYCGWAGNDYEPDIDRALSRYYGGDGPRPLDEQCAAALRQKDGR